MRDGARYNAIIELYDSVMETSKPADQIMHAYFRERKFIGSKDRRFIADGIYTLLRHYGRLNWWMQHAGMKEDGRSAVLLWLVLGVNASNDDIEYLFDGSGYGPGVLLGSERNALKRLDSKNFTHPDMPENIALECPDWAYDGLKTQFGDSFAAEMQAMQTEAPLDIRVNTLKAQRDEVMATLRKDDFKLRKSVYSPLGLRVEGRPPFSAHPAYQNGMFDIQDEGSQMLALLCGAKPGEWIVDFCAGAGGKTLALAAQMQNKGRIWACDIEQNRLENSRKRLRRSGVHCVEMQLLKNENDDWVKKHKQKADCVMIDAPCSGVGTWRRNPFMRWHNLGPTFQALTDVQQSILQSASRLVKTGGRLLYATCSMLPAENQLQVDRFLAANPDFKPVPLADMWAVTGFDAPQGLDLAVSSIQFTPAQHETDGFFISAMVRL